MTDGISIKLTEMEPSIILGLLTDARKRSRFAQQYPPSVTVAVLEEKLSVIRVALDVRMGEELLR